jgi:hypothetical protein
VVSHAHFRDVLNQIRALLLAAPTEDDDEEAGAPGEANG